jgi:peptidoglycan-associated lipoprotein
MSRLSLFIGTLAAAAVIGFGCGSGTQTGGISPRALPDPRPVDSNREFERAEREGIEEYENQKPQLALLTVHFEYDRYDLTEEAMEALVENAMVLSYYPDAVIRVEGHCDERGTEEYNMALGQKRARTVRDYLQNYGIDPQNISIISYGELLPAAGGHNETAWRQNRRADFVVLSE